MVLSVFPSVFHKNASKWSSSWCQRSWSQSSSQDLVCTLRHYVLRFMYVLKPTSDVHARAPIAGSPWLRAEWIFMGMCIAQVSWCDCCSAFRSECECLARAFQLCTRCVLDLHRACSRHASSVHWVCIYVYVYALWSDTGVQKKVLFFESRPRWKEWIHIAPAPPIYNVERIDFTFA